MATNDAVQRPGTISFDGRFPPTFQTHRVAWIDVARGIGIVLVVIGHSLGGLMSAGLAPFLGPFGVVFFAIYTFHMPLFFTLSAMFMPDRLRRNRSKIIKASLPRMVYPYFAWGTAQFSIIMLMGHAVNTPYRPDAMALVGVLWNPPSQFWFLYSLFLFQIAAVVFHRFATLNTMLWTAALARLLVEVVSLPHVVDMSLRYWIYYALAVRVAHHLRDAAVWERLSGLALALLIAAWGIAAVVSFEGGGDQSLSNIPAAILGTVLFLKLAQVPLGRLRPLLIALGQRSMPIFVTHVLVVAGTRIACTSILHVHDPTVILVTATVLGLTLPCLLFDVADRFGLAAILALE